MNEYLVGVLENIKSGQFDEDTFMPEKHNWELVKSWYHRYGNLKDISDKQLLDLLYFFYIRENLDFYDYEHFSQIGKTLQVKYGIERTDIPKTFSDFRTLVYDDTER